jgi:hypothetical protein
MRAYLYLPMGVAACESVVGGDKLGWWQRGHSEKKTWFTQKSQALTDHAGHNAMEPELVPATTVWPIKVPIRQPGETKLIANWPWTRLLPRRRT